MKNVCLVFFTIGLIVFCSCSPQYYFSDKVQTAGFTGRNQFVANGSIKPQLGSNSYRDTFKGEHYSFSTEAAFSFSNHFGVGVYWANLNNRRLTEVPDAESSAETGGNYNGKRCEFSFVYFTTIKKGELLELSGGYGNGNLNRVSSSFPFRDYQMNYHTYFVQGAYSYYSPFFRNTIGVKLKLNDYYSINTSDSFRNLKYGYTLEPLEKFPVLFSRFFFNSEVYFKFIGINAQVGCTFQPSRQLLADIPFYITAGLTLRFDKTLFEKTKIKINENL